VSLLYYIDLFLVFTTKKFAKVSTILHLVETIAFFFVVTRVVFVVKLGLSWAGVVYLSLLK